MIKIFELYHNLDYYTWMVQPRFYVESLMNYYSSSEVYRKANNNKEPLSS